MSTPDDHTIANATREFTAGLDYHTVGDVGPHLTCSEAEDFARFLRAVGAEDLASTLLAGHADGDDIGDRHYQGDDG